MTRHIEVRNQKEAHYRRISPWASDVRLEKDRWLQAFWGWTTLILAFVTLEYRPWTWAPDYTAGVNWWGGYIDDIRLWTVLFAVVWFALVGFCFFIWLARHDTITITEERQMWQERMKSKEPKP